MPGWLTLLLLVPANLLLGWLLLLQFTGWERLRAGGRAWPLPVPATTGGDGLTPLEGLFAALALGLTTTGWLALLLAELSWFSLARLALLWLVLILGLAVRSLKGGPAGAAPGPRPLSQSFAYPLSPPTLLLIAWLPVALWLFFRPHQFVQGAADAGVYVNLAANIVRSGGILIDDPLLAAMDPALYPALLRPLPPPEHTPYYLVPGFYVPGTPPGRIVPQFYPLHPVWQAIGYSLGGLDAALMMTGLWALLGALAVYLTVRQFAIWPVAALALAGLTFNALQIWFARYPTTEMLTQYLLWTGFWSIGAWLDERRPRPLWALLAGLTLGQTFLVRIDIVFLLAIPLLIFLWRYANGRLTRNDGWFFIPVTLLAVHATAHALAQSAPYFFNTFGYVFVMLRRFWLFPLLGGIALTATLFLLTYFRGRWYRLARYRRPMLGVIIVTLLLLAAYGAWLRPTLPSVAGYANWYDGRFVVGIDSQNVPRLAGYLSPLGLLLGLGGICILLWRADRRNAVLIGAGLFFSLLYLWRIQANPQQIYSMRRYVPAVMPFVIVGGAYFLGEWLPSTAAWRRALGVLLALAWLAGLGWLARGFVSQVDYAGLPEQLARLSSRFEPDAILIFNDAALVGQGDQIGTPLRFLHGHEVFILRDPARLDHRIFDQALQNWQSEARRIYWLAVPGGHSWPLDNWELVKISDYTIRTTALEGPEERRPTAVLPVEWPGEIYQLRPE